jgi:Raf kinase inhibitor-like YbhB/YbcL family protein
VSARSIVTLAVAAVLITVGAGCDEGDGKTLRPPTGAERQAMPTTTTSTTVPGLATGSDGAGATFSTAPNPSGIATAGFTMILPWAEGAAIDARFTCDGGDVSPLISWTAPPAGTVELALVMIDESADFVHWAVAGIPPTAGQKPEGTPFAGGFEGTNDFGNVGYQGPCPPAGAAHTYRFSLYALSQQAELPGDFTGDELEAVVGPAALSVTDVSGIYSRAG